jgi:hypothetical protein
MRRPSRPPRCGAMYTCTMMPPPRRAAPEAAPCPPPLPLVIPLQRYVPSTPPQASPLRVHPAPEHLCALAARDPRVQARRASASAGIDTVRTAVDLSGGVVRAGARNAVGMSRSGSSKKLRLCRGQAKEYEDILSRRPGFSPVTKDVTAVTDQITKPLR